MHTSFVLTLIGPDRRGLVESLSDAIAMHHGNWVESRMATVGGQFAGLVWVSVPTEYAGAMERALRALESRDLQIAIRPAEMATPQPARIQKLEVVGHDRPGIVRDLTRELNRLAINIEELTSESCSAPMSGELLFKAHVELGVPADTDVGVLQEALEDLAERLCLDLTYDEPRPTGE